MDLTAPTLVGFAQHLSGLAAATDALGSAAERAGLDAPVPTCPQWQVLDLVAHQGMVHRWARAAIRNDEAAMSNTAPSETEGRTDPDPVRWLRSGATELAATLEQAAPDLQALVFLKAAPPAREFWARRQCHETTIHALDALSAQHGQAPQAADAWFGPELAADGIDELLLGFWPRSQGKIRSSTEYAVRIVPTDAPVAWLVEVSEGPLRARRLSGTGESHSEAGNDTEASDGTQVSTRHTPVISGSAVDLYLALWNRGGSVTDEAGILASWSRDGAVQ